MIQLSGKKTVIIIAGPSGSGKSTVGRKIAERHGIEYVSGGEMFQKLFKEAYGLETDTAHKVAFQESREENHHFDVKVDQELIKRAEKGNVIIDGRMPAWLFKGKAVRVWLEASTKTRAERIAKRDGISVEEALKLVEKKDETDARIYSEIYNFKPWPDPKVFDVIVENDGFDEEKTFTELEKKISQALQKHQLQ